MVMTHAMAMPAKIFIGYGGHKGQEIAQDMCRWFRKRGLNAFTVAPAIRDSIPFLESEERILQTLSEFEAAVMICTSGAVGSSRFRDETEKLVYNLELPTITFVMDGPRSEHAATQNESAFHQELSQKSLQRTVPHGQQSTIARPRCVDTRDRAAQAT